MSLTSTRLAAVQLAELDDSRAFQGLTSAQHRFVTLVMSGLSNVEAFRAVYDVSGWTEGTAAGKASELANHPMVLAKLRELRQRVDAQSTLAPGLTREFVLNGLMAIALNGDKDSTRVSALVNLGKTVGIDLFRETVVTEKRVRTVADVEQELKDRLEELKQTLTVEGAARRVEPDSTAPPARDRRRKPQVG